MALGQGGSLQREQGEDFPALAEDVQSSVHVPRGCSQLYPRPLPGLPQCQWRQGLLQHRGTWTDFISANEDDDNLWAIPWQGPSSKSLVAHQVCGREPRRLWGAPRFPPHWDPAPFCQPECWHHICHHHPLSPKSCWAQGMTPLPRPARIARLRAKAEDGVP